MRRLWRGLDGLPPSLWILAAGTFVNRFGRFVLTFLALYVTRLGYSPVTAGEAVGAYGLGNVVAAGLGGYLADRAGRKATIGLSLVASAATAMSLSWARDQVTVTLLAFLAGVTSEMFRAPAGAFIADVVPPERRITGFAVHRLAMNLGAVLGPAIGGVVAERSFHWLFAADAATSIAFALLALLELPAPTPQADRPGSGKPPSIG
jgi:MFS family permease